MVCEKFNFNGQQCFQMAILDFWVYLGYCVAEARERNRREREAQAKMRARR